MKQISQVGISAVAIVLSMLSRIAVAQDADGDDVPDSVEAQLLSAVSPVIRTRDNTQRPPLTISWYTRHCRVRWFESASVTAVQLGDSGNAILTPAAMLALVSSVGAPHYRLDFRDAAWRNGADPTEPVTWASQQAAQQGIYGRVSPLPATGQYRLQYYMLFGLNTVDGGPGCPLGNHEGDWICIEFDVVAPNPSSPAIISAILHNHGRQIFIESGAQFGFIGTHPIVYLEIGSQEPWPYPSCDGFYPPDGTAHIPPPPGVSTNAVFLRGEHAFGCSYGGEYDPACGTADCYFQVSREHTGEGPQYLVTSVVNVGETDHPYPGEEVAFFHGYAGWYGMYLEDSCFWGLGPELDVTCPPSPRHQSKMWNREFSRTAPSVGPAWGWWSLHPMCRWVDFNDPSSGDGAYWNPWRAAEFVFGVANHTEPPGRIWALRGGSVPLTAPLTINFPYTLVSERGPTTIGR